MKKSNIQCTSAQKAAATVAGALLACGLLFGCASEQPAETTSEPETTQQTEVKAPEQKEAEPEEESASLEGHVLNIYCGAGMTDPFTEIADAFTQETGCEMNVTYANAAQIQTQIQTTGEGDMFIAGSKDEVTPVEESVEKSIDLVKHIPVLVIPADNPKNITSIADLTSAESLIVGDPESTPIGKIAKKALTEAGLWDELMSAGVITTTTTAPQIGVALANGEGDAGIVWKENANVDGVSIVDTPDLDGMIKVIPCAVLTSAADAEASDEFQAFLQSDTAWDIWTSYGYERADA